MAEVTTITLSSSSASRLIDLIVIEQRWGYTVAQMWVVRGWLWNSYHCRMTKPLPTTKVVVPLTVGPVRELLLPPSKITVPLIVGPVRETVPVSGV